MRNLLFTFVLCLAVAITALIPTSFTSQAQRAVAPTANDALLSRVQELEKKVDQLQKEMAGAKLVVSGLDKSLSGLKTSFDGHTHKLAASNYTFEQFRIDSSNGKALYAPIANADQIKINKGFLTTAPVK